MDALSTVFFLCLGFLAGKAIVAMFSNMSDYKGPGIENYEDGCSHNSEPHQYFEDSMEVAMIGLEPKSYLICSKCGYLSGSDKKLNKEALAMAVEKQARITKKREEQEKILEALRASIYSTVYKYELAQYVSISSGQRAEMLTDLIMKDLQSLHVDRKDQT